MNDGITTPAAMVAHGVPEGSVLRPLVIIMYTTDIPCIVNGHLLMYLCYADDTREYFHMKVYKILVVKGVIEDCISYIHHWLASNQLPLNPDKTEAMWCLSVKTKVHSISHHSLLVTQWSFHQMSFVTLRCNLEKTFQLPIRSVRSITVATTIFGSFGQFDHIPLQMLYMMRHVH